MAEYYRGFESGIVAGIVYAVIDSIVFFVAGSSLMGVSYDSWTLIMLSFLVNLIVGAVVGGLALGSLYAGLYGSLPGKSPMAKGMIMGTLFWLVFGVAMNSASLTVVAFLVESFALKVIVFGALLGFFWKLFGTKR